MFSPQIQNYINSSSQAQAYSRASELTRYINTIYPNENTQEKTVSAFNQILSESKGNVENSQGSIFEIDLPPNINQNKISSSNFGSLSGIKKVKSIESTGKTTKSSSIKSEISQIISNVCDKYNVDKKLIHALIKQESGYNPNAVSSVGAKGLMQLMPQTAKSLGVKNIFSPQENIEGGVKYFKQMLDKYNGNKILALAAYNAGSGAVDKYNGVPPYKETQNYVRAILKNYL